jgi:hypothetical protein
MSHVVNRITRLPRQNLTNHLNHHVLVLILTAKSLNALAVVQVHVALIVQMVQVVHLVPHHRVHRMLVLRQLLVL